jgi:L-fuconolactonase
MVQNKIDAHQHFWQFDPVRDSWITEEMAVIKADFFPGDLQPLLQQNDFAGCVAVQASQAEEENHFLLNLAAKFEMIKGVVGWVDLRAENVEERLAYYRQFSKMKGFRHVLQGEAQRDMMLQPAFMKGISLLSNFNFTYDILIFEDQLKYTASFVAAFPDQPFVIDHLAKPKIKDGKIDQWKKDMAVVAGFENVCCKLSGMVTEADWKNWKSDDFKPYMDAVVELFGVDRIMFGSDWPVCLVAGSYENVVALVEDYFSAFSQEEQEKIFRENANRFYHLVE